MQVATRKLEKLEHDLSGLTVLRSTCCGMVYEMRTKTRSGYFFYYYFFLLFRGYLYHTISIRDLKIELFKVLFHRGQLPCSGLNQRTKENVIAKGRLFKVYHSNSKGCQNFGWENWCNIRWRKRIPLYNFRRVSCRFCGKNENARPNTVHLNNQIQTSFNLFYYYYYYRYWWNTRIFPFTKK